MASILLADEAGLFVEALEVRHAATLVYPVRGMTVSGSGRNEGDPMKVHEASLSTDLQGSILKAG
jgi:hypothetical protein